MRHRSSRKPRQRAPTKRVPAPPTQAQSHHQSVQVQPSNQYNSVVPPTQIWCFICNSNYWTSVSSGNASQVSITRILTFCDLFSLRDEAERQCLLRLSYLDDPFCTSCSLKINQLQDWIAQLASLQKGIDSLKSDMGKLMVDSYPASPNIEGTHHIKGNIVRVWKPSFPTTSRGDPQQSSTSFQPLDNLVQAAHHLTASSEDNTRSNETVFEIEEVEVHSEDGYFDEPDDKSDDGSTNSEAEPAPKKRNSGLQKKPKQKREPSVRQSSGEKIEAHPDGRCRLCPSTFKSQMQLAKHIRRKHSGIVHPCRYCDKTFQDTSNRKKHEFSLHICQSRDYVCEQCGNDFKTPGTLRAHVQQIHEGIIMRQRLQIPSQCDECGRVCTTIKNLQTHIRGVHKGGIRKPCSICGRPFKDRQHLKKHERTHISASDLLQEGKYLYYKCTVCPDSFRAKVALEDHYATEHPTNPKPKIDTKPTEIIGSGYQCPDCPFTRPFTRKATLEQHIRNGHAPKKGLLAKYGRDCNICGRPCRNPTMAVLHQGTHLPRDYFCNLCSFQHSRKETTIRHYAKMHRHVKLPKLRTLRNIPYKKYFCPACPDHPGFSLRLRVRAHMKAHRLGTLHELDESEEYKEIGPDDEEEEEEENSEEEAEDDAENDMKMEDKSDSSEEDDFVEVPSVEIPSRSFSSRGRVLQPPKRFRASTSTNYSMGIEKEVEIPLERVDQNWPKGRVKRIRSASDEQNTDNEVGEYKAVPFHVIDIEHEDMPSLVTVEDDIKIEEFSLF